MADLVDIGPRWRLGPGLALVATLRALADAQRGALMPWSAVMLGLGIALYFALPQEPGAMGYGWAGSALVLGLGLALGWRERFGPLGLAIALVALGVLVAGWRAHAVAGPVLEFRYYGPIEGRVIGLDRSASDAVRLTLDQVRLGDMAPARTPDRVRVSLHGAAADHLPEPGATVMMTGHLAAPAGPVEPGGFDFERHAYFLSLGGVGYTRTPVVLLEPRAPGTARIFALRMQISAALQERIEGQAGAFAAAVLTGDRSGLEAGPTQAMRDANIAHLLAISGLHMGLLTGFVFAALRLGLALIPALALRYPIRKWAAVGALAAGAFYLALSGGNVATERAFVQVAVMFAAVLLDRRAITLRSVAIAAVIVLVNRPETLMSPGFQMSFAATAALVGVFAALRGRRLGADWPGPAKWALALVVSSFVAGAATAPFAAAHFNQVAVYGLLANLLTVPVMGSVVIPAAVVAALLTPLQLAAPMWWIMEGALVWILWVAELVADWPGAVRPVAMPAPWVLGAVSLGGLILLLWQGGLRWLGAAPILLAILYWQAEARPSLLISDSGGLVGVLTPEGRALSRERGEGFVAEVWLEDDGDLADQAMAAARAAWRDHGLGQSADVAGWRVWHGRGQRAADTVATACAEHDIVVLSEPAPEALNSVVGADLAARLIGAGPVMLARAEGCLIFDAALLRRTGALAVDFAEDTLIVTTARMRQGDRLWSPAP